MVVGTQTHTAYQHVKVVKDIVTTEALLTQEFKNCLQLDCIDFMYTLWINENQ